MYSSSRDHRGRRVLRAACLILLTATAEAGTPFVLGGGIGADDTGGLSLDVLADISLTERTWLTVSGGSTDADTETDSIRTNSAQIGMTQEFGAIGIGIGAGTWGDSGRLESNDLNFDIFWKSDSWRIALDYERRDIDLTLVIAALDITLPDRQLSTSLDGDGIGASVRYRTEKNTSFTVRARQFDYSRDISRLDSLELIRRISPTTLTLAGALRDAQYSAMIEWEEGNYRFGLEVAKDTLAVGDLDVTSVTGSLLAPLGRRMDIEVNVGFSNADGVDSGAYGGVFLFFYGGG